MAVGQLLSERAVHQLEPSHEDSPLVGSLLMFGSNTARVIRAARVGAVPAEGDTCASRHNARD